MELGRDELLWINNALNEILHGPEAIQECEFHSRTGGEKLAVEALLTKVSDRMDELRRPIRTGDDGLVRSSRTHASSVSGRSVRSGGWPVNPGGEHDLMPIGIAVGNAAVVPPVFDLLDGDRAGRC
jgi:hypothetical protein